MNENYFPILKEIRPYEQPALQAMSVASRGTHEGGGVGTLHEGPGGGIAIVLFVFSPSHNCNYKIIN